MIAPNRMVAMYRTIDTALWSDPAVRQLGSASKLLFLYLITNPHAHVSGIYFLPRLYISHDTGLPEDSIGRGIDTLSSAGLVRIDLERDVIWVVNMLRYQGRGEKMQRAAAAQLRTLHKSPLIRDFLKSYPAVKRYFRDRVSDTPSKGNHERVLIGIQEQEQEQEQEQKTPLPPLRGVEFPASLNTEKFQAAWEQWETHRREIRHALKDSTRKSQMKKLAEWGEAKAVAAIEQSILHGWQGLFEPGANGKATASDKPMETTAERLERNRRALEERRQADAARADPPEAIKEKLRKAVPGLEGQR